MGGNAGSSGREGSHSSWWCSQTCTHGHAHRMHSQGPSRELGSREHERVIFGGGTVVGICYFFI